jgi:GDP-4-dehydro-6-deoxy-D-mannose reductase
MLAYITGGAGFVGHWLADHLLDSGDEVVAVDAEVDVTEPAAVRASMTKVSPEVVYHLAGLAHVGRSWEDPALTFKVNALGTLNVLEAAAACLEPPRVVIVSSAEVYGAAGGEPLTESAPLRPVSPYASSKVAAEFLGLQAFLGRGLPVVVVRPFNHVGPGQAPDFVVSALARRLVEAERAGANKVAVGNLEAVRDFTDVRDVVRAYRLLAVGGEPGEVYNVASGRGLKVGEVAERLIAIAGGPVELVLDESLYRPVDVPIFLGDASKLVAATGWSPAVPLEETLADVISFWRRN